MVSVSTLKKIGLFAGGVLSEQSESALKQGCEEGIYELHSSCTARKRLRDEDSDDSTGECRGYPCGSSAINEKRAAEEAAAVQADESGAEDNGAEDSSAKTA